MTATATGMLTRAARSITSAVDLGASTADVMLATVVGLRGHDHAAGCDRSDSRELANLYPKLLGSGTEGEPSMFELVDEPDETPAPDLPAGVSDDAPSSSHEDGTGPTEGTPAATAPTSITRPKRHYPHRRAMTLRLEPEMWRRLHQVALDNETHCTDIIRAALERHLAYLDGQKTRRSAS